MRRITLRLPEDLHRRLRQTAIETGASLNETIVVELNRALAPNGGEDGPRAEERERVRRALGDLIVDMDARLLPAELRPRDDLPNTNRLRESLPMLLPPLSTTMIEGREDRV